MSFKTCSKCKEKKPVAEFSKDRTKADGYYSSCKWCQWKKNNLSTEERSKRRISSIRAKYGVDNISQLPWVQEKIKKNCLKKYGVEAPIQSKKVKEKIKKTWLKEYGVDNPLKSKKIREKIKQTNLEKYGAEHTFQAEPIKEKIKQTNLKKYGVENPSTSKLIKQKKIQTSLKKYGTEYPRQNKEFINNYINKSKQNGSILTVKIDNKLYSISELASKYGRSATRIRQLLYQTGESNLIKWLKSKKPQRSSCEIWLESILKDLEIYYIKNDRSIINPLELDFYIPDKQLAIEVNGFYWHSSNFVEKNYHELKYRECKKENIQLLQIYDIDIRNKPAFIKSLIKTSLGEYKSSITAEACSIIELSASESTKFIIKNYIYKNIDYDISLGLKYKNDLKASTVFNKINLNYELTCYCTKLNEQTIGGGFKLLKYFINKYNPKEIIAYCNTDLFSEEFYERLGFTLLEEESSYFYARNLTKESRINYKNNNLISLLDNFNPNLTNEENLFNNNYRKIYTSGLKVYKYTI